MGADIDVRQGRESYCVTNVTRDSFVVTVDGKPLEVLMNRGKINLKVNPQLKLSDKTAVVNALKFERTYTPETDPNKKWAAAQSGSAAQSAVGTSAGRMAGAQMGANLAEGYRNALLAGRPGGGGGGGSGGMAVDAGTVSTANSFRQADAALGSDQNSAGYAAAQLQEELEKGLVDAVRVTAEISAPVPMSDPYVVIITQYREKDDPGGAARNWVYACQLDRLDEKPVKIRILKGGFPPGFEVLRQQIHVYGGGRELGTNVADKNVPLTRDEAHEYLIIDHLTTHKGATLPPAVAFGVNAWDVQPHYSAEQAQQVVYVKVTRGGLPQGAFRDENCSRRAGDSYLEQLVEQVRFKPALQAGKAVDGVAQLKIADLAL